MRSYYLVLIFAFLYFTPTFSNGGSFTRGNFSSGQLILMDDKNISIKEEDLKIELFRGYARVNLTYIMENNGGSTIANFGFPSLLFTRNTDKSNKKEIEEYNIQLQRKRLIGYSKSKTLTHRYLDKKEQITWLKVSDKYTEMDRENISHPDIAWYISKIEFKEKEIIKLNITYLSNYLNYKWFVSDNGKSENSEFRYLLSIGSTWKGPIKKGTVAIDSSNIQDEIEILPSGRFSKDNNKFIWKFKNLEPKTSDNILVTVKNRFGFDSTYASTGVQMFYTKGNKYYTPIKHFTSKASSTLKGYSVKSINDRNFETAWVEGKEGDGVGEYVEFSSSKPRKIKTIGIIPGYNKSKELFYKNNRVAEIEIAIDGKKIKTVQIPDGHTSFFSSELSAYHLIHLDDQVKCRNIRLTITKIHKGTVHNDTCISEIMLLQQLTEKPRKGGR